ncbi:hypothetical protein HOO65_090152 [Ceratocystis lukuohia]|uniref:EKC/KEOPS complex subunit BUD32 n=1 Tax=Ceratocystis lukuohia TaxID=2019550 RepID=A0ABR4M9B3_9PEZI
MANNEDSMSLEEEILQLRQALETQKRNARREKEQALEQARIEKEQALEQARIENEQALEQARIEKEQALKQARIENEQALEAREEEIHIVKQRADKAEAINRPMEFYECLAFCHKIFMNKKISTFPSTDSATKPAGRLRPTYLKQWLEFPAMKLEMLTKVGDAIPRGTRAFLSQSDITGVVGNTSSMAIDSESSLGSFQTIHLENPLTQIMDQLQSIPEARRVLADTSSLLFRSWTNSEIDSWFENRGYTQESSSRLHTRRPQPDKVCLVKKRVAGEAEVERLAYVIKYKLPAKFSMDAVRAAIRPMNLAREVINKNKIPNDPSERFVHKSAYFGVAAVVQTYEYMIRCGLEYGLLTTCEAYIFLKIDWTNPEVVYYHVADPETEVRENSDGTFWSAVAQVLAFSLIALEAPIHDFDTRNKVIEELPTWQSNPEATESSSSGDERSDERNAPHDSDFRPSSQKLNSRAPYITRSNTRSDTTTSTIPSKRRRSSDCNRQSFTQRGDSPSSGNDGDGYSAQQNTTASSARQVAHSNETSTTRGTAQNQSTSQGQDQNQNQGRQARLNEGATSEYCTSQCLSGLVNGTKMDPYCPNYSHHLYWQQLSDIESTDSDRAEPHGRDNYKEKLGHLHPVDHTTWLSLLHAQISRTVIQGFTPLGLAGSSGVLFRLTLIEYDYTFVAKATVEWMIKKLRREEDVYRVLKSIQGQYIPVYLGSVDMRCLNTRVFVDFGIDLVYLVLLSYGGRGLRSVLKERTKEQGQELDGQTRVAIGQQVINAVSKLHALNVVHTDVRGANFLVDDSNNVMVIDFERALILPYSLEECHQQLREAQKRQDTQDSRVAISENLETKRNRDSIRYPKGNEYTRQQKFVSRCVAESQQDIICADILRLEIQGE